MNNPWQHFTQYLKPTIQSTVIAQQQWLAECLAYNQQSAYGQHYHFASIHNIAEYQAQVPVTNYELLSPWIEKLLQGETNQLFNGEVVAFEKTGGSYSGGKLFPYSARGLKDFRHALLNWLAELIAQYKITQGKVYWALSPATAQPQTTANGIAIGGGDSLYLGNENLAAFMALSAVPLSVGQVNSVEDWQLLTLYYLLCSDDLVIISIWSPSFLIQLLKAIQQQQNKLLDLLNNGGMVAGHILEKDVGAAQRLQQYLSQQQTQIIWPNLALISCWADASSAMQAKVLADYFPYPDIQPKGLLSTEAVITVPNQANEAVLCTASNFYEFLDKQGKIYLAHELEVQQSYQVIVTTNSGLYRYNTTDIVACLGYQQNRPILKFVGRAGIVSDLVGEKLTESFVNQCLAPLKGFAMLCTNKQQCSYILLIDKNYFAENIHILITIEQALCNNPQYEYARKLNQLAPLTYKVIDVPEKQYLTWQLAKGKRLGDIKIPALFLGDWKKVFQA
ncbi:GH3 family domain-containing protein [Entomomonas asaccharolytica]|uniref:GH3 auxin-responsive promoter family protein n=1 Tax=Entomomonas asaccharolytica TaxID=2785331 RepID=A0A974RY02_9GAMM|nr:GH3 auxin-responsive promoter family protein [Entomomonas asaccharolytica]QQP86781.1 GH3 auxin-responsive promoter family protein [Entomomonas asaccharolytica]